jgi:hypothetical protein
VIVGLVPLPPSPDQEDDAITFVPQVIDRYPLDEATERCGYELPPTLPFFAMPEGALRTSECTGGGSSSQKSSRNKKPLDRFFTFVLTDGSGASYYGGCLERFFAAADGTAMPRAACVLSRVPAFMAFRDVLVRLHVLTGGVAPLGATAVRCDHAPTQHICHTPPAHPRSCSFRARALSLSLTSSLSCSLLTLSPSTTCRRCSLGATTAAAKR